MTPLDTLKPFIYETPEVGYGYLWVPSHHKHYQTFDTRLPQANDFQALILTTNTLGSDTYIVKPKVYKVRFEANLGMVSVFSKDSIKQLLHWQGDELVPTPKARASSNCNPYGIYTCKDYTTGTAVTYLLRPDQTVLSFQPVHP
jgi:hypothetical protein